MSTEKEDVPHVDLRVTCPVKQRLADVGVNLNMFREKVSITGCTHLDTGETCAGACLVTTEVHEVLTHIMRTEKAGHKEELKKIGPEVIG